MPAKDRDLPKSLFNPKYSKIEAELVTEPEVTYSDSVYADDRDDIQRSPSPNSKLHRQYR